MKNTEYKDIFDFGEEALAINDKFSNTTFPTMKNAFTIGENIREMKNVSPLATVKFFNQSTLPSLPHDCIVWLFLNIIHSIILFLSL
ncbi:hypothetical protein [Chryseobacterium chendengshani]|uniref:hypothetical protein n=1 Tax=Chryseobacterium sp. LJ756 TaxID=2864113 RepID=UPI001C63CF13|nr:hypothetical protein [Chryseobacterium sp. LJ756]MBW7675493.1 hypothetical protein [Chryseobacterium sp. LJ756]